MPFEFDFTQDKLQAMLPRNPDALLWYDAIITSLERYEISTVNRVAAFMAQCAHESLDFTVLEENLNYSEQALLRVFRKYFDADSAKQYARKPEAIANVVYANRMGNGDTDSGDGWRFRGRGIVQLTGRSNYTTASDDIYGTDILVQHPDVVSTRPDVATEVACWFWNRNRLNRLADEDNIDGITYRINGGYNGQAERTEYYERNKHILS